MRGSIVALSHRVLLSDGWSRRLVALLAGAAGALAQAPIGFFPAFAVSFPVAVWLLDGATPGPSRLSPRPLLSAAADGWWFGFGYFLAGLWWIGAAFLVETDEFLWAMPLGVLGLPAGLGLFMALGFALARLVWFTGVARLFSLAFGLGIAEWLRHFVLTGFPWNTFGQGFGSNIVTAQAASLIGADGLGLLAILIFASPATLADEGVDRPSTRPVAVAAVALATLVAFGITRLALTGGLNPAPAEIESVPDVRLRLVQPNMSQREKIAQRDGIAVLTRLFQLSDRSTGPRSTGMADATHIIWPESPFPFLLASDPRALADIARLLPAKTGLITGAVRAETPAGQPRRFYNALLAFGAGGRLVATYDKVHLVPFGEYLPLEGVLSGLGLRRFVHAPGSFAVGERRPLLAIPGLPPALPLICYEAIFPHEMVPPGERPGLILNITNDAWFGETFGPHQHFAQVRLRAIEFGLPVVRVANTGISGVIDPYGRVLAAIPVGVESISDVFLPKALTSTRYSSNQINVGGVGSILALVLGLGFASVGRLKTRQGNPARLRK